MWPRNAGSTIGLSITDCAHVNIIGLKMGIAVGAPSTGIFATGVSILGTLGSHDSTIRDCFIHATAGVLVAAACAPYNSIIKGCTIHATALTINDPSNLFKVVDNDLLSDADAGATGSGAIIANKSLAARNKVTGSGSTNGRNADYPFVKAFTS